jgi:hypothetical protein
MTVELVIAAVGCFLLAVGHATIGVRWVLPHLSKDRLRGTPFGSPSLTLNMIRFTWHIVTVFLLALAILLAVLALAPHADTKILLLRWLGALWLAATALALWNARRRPRSLLRLPVPLVFMLVAAMCLIATA